MSFRYNGILLLKGLLVTFWWILWIFLSLFLLSFLGWTLFILFSQKAVWKKFAQKHKLRYQGNALMQMPAMDGTMGGYRVGLFSSEHVQEDVRGSRKLTAIEISLNSTMPIDGAVANEGMVNFVNALEFKTEARPKHEKWSKSYIAAADSKLALLKYLTDERLDALCSLMKVKNAWLIFIFRQNKMLLRIDTPNPLSDTKNLEELISQMLSVAALLELGKGEAAILKSEALKTEARESAGVLDAAGASEGLKLELEDDDGEAVEEAEAGDEDQADTAEKPETKKS